MTDQPPLDYEPIGSNAYKGPIPDKDATNMAMLCHLLAIFTWFLGPLIIWLIKKDTSPFVDDQGREALNFQIIAMIVTIGCVFTFCAAPFLIAIVQITRIVFCIIGAVEASKGVAYRYPLTLRLIK